MIPPIRTSHVYEIKLQNTPRSFKMDSLISPFFLIFLCSTGNLSKLHKI